MKFRTMLLLTGIIIAASFGGVSTSAMVADTGLSRYSFDNSDATGYCSWRGKDDTSKVYVHPLSGPKVNYTVQSRLSNGTVVDCSSTVSIPLGVRGSITNYVRENGGTAARLKFKRINYARENTVGEWSPDSTRNYTVYN